MVNIVVGAEAPELEAQREPLKAETVAALAQIMMAGIEEIILRLLSDSTGRRRRRWRRL